MSYFTLLDLREDKQFFAEHPGVVPITTAQVSFMLPLLVKPFFLALTELVIVWFVH